MIAANEGHLEVVEALLNAKAPVDYEEKVIATYNVIILINIIVVSRMDCFIFCCINGIFNYYKSAAGTWSKFGIKICKYSYLVS